MKVYVNYKGRDTYEVPEEVVNKGGEELEDYISNLNPIAEEMNEVEIEKKEVIDHATLTVEDCLKKINLNTNENIHI